MNGTDPLLMAWHETLVRRRDDPAVVDDQKGDWLRFADVEDLSWHYQRKDELLGRFEPGQVVGIQLGNHSHWPAVFLACLRKEIVALPLERSLGAQELAAALKICRVSGLLRDPKQPIEHISAEAVPWSSAVPALLKLTSGTTAAPRAIPFRSGQLLADAVQICDTMGISQDDLNFAVIPISHSYGFSNLIVPLLVRGVPMVISSDRLPRAILEDLARTNATVFPGTPSLFQALAEMPGVPPLPRLRLCISAGAPLTLSVAHQFCRKFSQRIHSFYGASECGGICYDREARLEVEGFVGPAMNGVILHPIGNTTEATQVRVESAAAGKGYFPEPDPDKLGSGFFIPDDLLSFGETGLRIVGRLSDVINVAGRKVNPAEVEAALLSYPGVREAVVFGRASESRHQEVAACVVAAPNATEAGLRQFCRARLSSWQAPRHIFLVDALPVNERGKISRRQLARHFETRAHHPA